jgi:hypothetical protein
VEILNLLKQNSSLSENMELSATKIADINIDKLRIQYQNSESIIQYFYNDDLMGQKVRKFQLKASLTAWLL